MDKRILVSDTSVLINFLKIDRMDLIRDVSFQFIATEHVADEITQNYSKQFERFRDAVALGVVEEITLDTTDELVLYARLTQTGRIGLGECSAISYASTRGCVLAIDDRRATREATKVDADLEILRTEDLVVLMIQETLLTVVQADLIKREWEADHRFALKFGSFQELIDLD